MLFVAIILSTVCHYSLVKWYKQHLIQAGAQSTSPSVVSRAVDYIASAVGWVLFSAVIILLFYLASLI